ncbi:MAG TPA: hypothetical protein VGB00_04520 [Pyrinomonadaceae bacterium]
MGESKKVTNETGETEKAEDEAVRVGTIWDARPIEDEDEDDDEKTGDGK